MKILIIVGLLTYCLTSSASMLAPSAEYPSGRIFVSYGNPILVRENTISKQIQRMKESAKWGADYNCASQKAKRVGSWNVQKETYGHLTSVIEVSAKFQCL